MKIDPSSQISFCTRNNSEIDCWRDYQKDFWTYPDIICSDLPDGECPGMDTS